MYGLGTRLRPFDELHLRRYDLYDIAYLAGGHRRVADTAVVALVETGRVRVAPDGRLSVVRWNRRHPVEAATLDIIGIRGWRSVVSVRRQLEGDPRVAGIAGRLAADGLLRRISLPTPWRHRLITLRTGTGRRLLRQLSARPTPDPVAPGTSALLVALGGHTRMGDPQRRAEVFAPLAAPKSPGSWSTDPRVGGRPCSPPSRDGVLGHRILGGGFWYGG